MNYTLKLNRVSPHVVFLKPPDRGMQQSTFFLKATLSIATFSNFENMDFALSDF